MRHQGWILSSSTDPIDPCRFRVADREYDSHSVCSDTLSVCQPKKRIECTVLWLFTNDFETLGLLDLLYRYVIYIYGYATLIPPLCVCLIECGPERC